MSEAKVYGRAGVNLLEPNQRRLIYSPPINGISQIQRYNILFGLQNLFLGNISYLCGVRLTDKISDMNQSYKVVTLTVKWCQKFFSAPRTKRRKELLVMVYDSPTDNIYGQYCNDNHWLTINLHNCNTIKDIIKTTIHEYTHVCQDLKEYALMNKTVGYNNNPFEIEATYNENTYYYNCWRSIKKEIQ